MFKPLQYKIKNNGNVKFSVKISPDNFEKLCALTTSNDHGGQMDKFKVHSVVDGALSECFARTFLSNYLTASVPVPPVSTPSDSTDNENNPA